MARDGIYEIERKFLVNWDLLRKHLPKNCLKQEIDQFYISEDPEISCRVTSKGTWGDGANSDPWFLGHDVTLRIKNKKDKDFARIELEFAPLDKKISTDIAQQLLIRRIGRVEKTRLRFRYREPGMKYLLKPKMFWEIDIYKTPNRGLIVAEIELPTISYPLFMPPWIEKEITNDDKYSNLNLSKNPFYQWPENCNG